MLRPLLLLTALPAAAAAAPPVLTVAPPKPGGDQLVTVSSDVAAKWSVRGAGDVLKAPDGKSVAFFMPAAPVLVLAAPADPAALADVAAVTVGGAGPQPQPPQPGPQPKPPEPTPPPKPPAPLDPLTKRLKEAFGADPAAADKKAAAKLDLAELYRQAAGLCAAESVATAGQLKARVSAAAQVLAPDSLVGVRKVVAEELGRCLPTDPDEELSATNRKAAAELFGRLAAALESF